jgi:hypothetical protein
MGWLVDPKDTKAFHSKNGYLESFYQGSFYDVTEDDWVVKLQRAL